MEKHPSNKPENTKKKSESLDPLWMDIENHGYKLRGKLGEGSYGIVYKAKCITTGNYYAIKLIKNPFENHCTAK